MKHGRNVKGVSVGDPHVCTELKTGGMDII